jgi:hypothetical protein
MAMLRSHIPQLEERHALSCRGHIATIRLKSDCQVSLRLRKIGTIHRQRGADKPVSSPSRHMLSWFERSSCGKPLLGRNNSNLVIMGDKRELRLFELRFYLRSAVGGVTRAV